MTGSCFTGRKISGDPGYGRLPVFIDIKRNGSPAGNGEKADLYIGSPLPKRYDTQIKINVENEPVKKNVPGSCSNRKDRPVIPGCKVGEPQVMERTKGLKEYIQTKEYRESLGLSGQVTETYTMLAQGEYNRNYTFTHPITGQKLVLRINFGSQMHLKDQILYEYRALKLLENSGRTPKAIYADGSCKNLPYGVMVMEFLPGHSLDYKTELFSAAGCLADIHSVKMPETHSLIQPKEPLKAILEECEAMVKTYMESELGDEQKKRRIRSLLDQGWKAVENLETDIPYHCCINTELNSTNFLVNDRNVDGRRINENSVGEKTGDCIKDNEKKHIW